MMNLLRKKNDSYPYSKENEQPVIKSSICTGEQVAGFKNRTTGEFRDVMLIRDAKDLDHFMEIYNLEIVNIKKEY